MNANRKLTNVNNIVTTLSADTVVSVGKALISMMINTIVMVGIFLKLMRDIPGSATLIFISNYFAMVFKVFSVLVFLLCSIVMVAMSMSQSVS